MPDTGAGLLSALTFFELVASSVVGNKISQLLRKFPGAFENVAVSVASAMAIAAISHYRIVKYTDKEHTFASSCRTNEIMYVAVAFALIVHMSTR